jgi:tetratricopeptide (TPR) repeat protein
VLREAPDADTVLALARLAGLETSSGDSAEGKRLVTEALDLAQANGAGTSDLARLFITRGIAHALAERLADAACDLRESVRLAERAGDYGILGRAQLNLADVLVRSEPQAAAEAARSAIAHLRRTGQRSVLGVAVGNMATALIELGEWDEAAAVLQEALDVDHLDDDPLNAVPGWFAGLRGDGQRAAAGQESLNYRRQTEDPQDQACIGLLDATVALCAGDVAGALAHAMGVLGKADALGIGHDDPRWAWPLAARAARSLGETGTLEHLVALVDAHPVGHVPPLLRAERQLVSALAAADADGAGATSAVAAVQAAVESLRAVGNPYQLAHALIDLAEVLARAGDDGVESALAEATTIAERLGCPPLAARAASVGSLYARADAAR